MAENEVVKAQEAVQEGKMEFRLINPTEDGFLRRIQWNKEELEATVRAKIANYENVVYTDENIKEAKSDRAELNKLLKAIEDRRKQVKKIINEPYAVFEAELKEITALINKPVSLIDQQVKAYEERQKEEKKATIKSIYDESIGNLAQVLPFEKIFDVRYLNQTFKMSVVEEEIKEKITRVRTDLETIDSLESKYKLNAKDVYIKTFDLSKAMAENKRLADLEEKLEADKRRKEEEAAERKRLEEIRRKKEAEEQAAREAAEAERKAEEAKRKSEETERKSEETERKSEETERKLAEVQRDKEIREAAGAEEQPSPRSAMGQVIGSIERSAFAYSTGEETQATPEDRVIDAFAQKEESKQEKKYRVRFFADGTREQLSQLIAFMNENNIKYGKITKEDK